MISPDIQANILRLYFAEKWRIGTIATQLSVHHQTVRRVLHAGGVGMGASRMRPSMIDPYVPFIKSVLKRYPKLTASRLYEMVRQRGYPGGRDHFRHLVALHRPRQDAEAFVRLKTLPGEQAQVDWAHFGKVSIGHAERRLAAFVMVLSWSRHIFLRFYLDQRLENFLRGHVAAFAAFEGVPRVLLYDNLKSAVLERQHDAIRFHPTLLAFAAHYRYEPRPVAVARGNEKGRVERAIHYIRQAFFAAREWTDLDDLNAQAAQWCGTIAAGRPCPEERSCTVGEAFEQEKTKLIARPGDDYPTDERVEVRVGKTPYVRFDGNDYSVPHTHVRRILVVSASPETVRVIDGQNLLATHPRSYSRGELIEDEAHIAALVAQKRQAREHRGVNRITSAAPSATLLLMAIAERGGNIGASTQSLNRLLDAYGAKELEAAIAEAHTAGTPTLHAVHLVLDRRLKERNMPPPIPVRLPDDPRIRDIVVLPHDLKAYDPREEDKNDD